jgi:TnsA endonuclease N terminal
VIASSEHWMRSPVGGKELNMRKGKRFTPGLLDRWEKQGRGTGSGADYQPWHQVTRSDPSSRGRSHLIFGNAGRLIHLLSDAEYVAFAFATMCAGLAEVREQFELPTTSGLHQQPGEPMDGWVHGTEEIARDLGLRHPTLRRGNATRAWSMTSDLVLIFDSDKRAGRLLAVSVKYDEEVKQSRTMELLHLEREFWRRRGVQWILLTPKQYHPLSQGVLSAGLVWVVGQPRVRAADIERCRQLQPQLEGMRMHDICRTLREQLGMKTTDALSAFWGSVWAGALTLDMAQAWRSDQPVRFVSSTEFIAQNPIASRRSSWSD